MRMERLRQKLSLLQNGKNNFSSLPAKGLISIKRTLKANVELEKKSYQFSSHSLLITVVIFDQNKKTVDSATSGSTNSYLSVGKDKVEEYIKKEYLFK